ncbi:MAG: large conductance mechanosensitive channel protein MscL [Lachnospiraceae bacterium]|jgi:large conductance mechanosensitive channel|nr:large conductance mechanosensitive channel protein MscL [Lachnospiraceae bacterium]
MKKFLEEFREFALKGNVMDMAIGVIIGGAFQNIVKALIDDIINPLIGLLFQADFSNVVIPMGNSGVSLAIGAFISVVINFILMALVLFLMVKGMNRLRDLTHKKEAEKPAEPAKPTQEELLTQILAELQKKDAK